VAENQNSSRIAHLLNDKRLLGPLFGTKFFYGDLQGDRGETSRTLRKLGFSDEEMRNGTYQNRIHPEDRPTYLDLWKRVNEGWEDEIFCEYRLSDLNGKWHWIETHAIVVERQEDGSIATIVGVDREIDSRKSAEEYLKQQFYNLQEKYKMAESLRQTSTLIAADPGLSHNLGIGIRQLGTIVNFDQCEVYSLESGKLIELLVHPGDCDKQLPDLTGLLNELKSSPYPIIRDDAGDQYKMRSLLAVPLRQEDKTVGVVLLGCHDTGRFRGADLYPVTAFADILAVVIRNNQEFRKTVAELEADGLTGLLTRRSFDREAPVRWKEFGELYPENAIAMIDIDHFKRVNDSYGHPAGDLVIKKITELFSLNLRQGDILARYGGEEFIAVLPNTTGTAARQIMDRIREICANREMYEFPGAVTVSIGIAASDSTLELPEMIIAADKALYRAKANGRNRVEYC
jgi:diguanylate cyclase (GGDEF)-like protein/PAS domain S-box-containing protein